MSTKKIQVNSALFRTAAKTRRNRKSAADGVGGENGDLSSASASASASSPVVSSSRLRSELMRRFKSNLNARFGGRRKRNTGGESGSAVLAAAGEGDDIDDDDDDNAARLMNAQEDEFQGALQFMSQQRQQARTATTTPTPQHKRTQRLPVNHGGGGGGGGGSVATSLPQQFPFVMTQLPPALQHRNTPVIPTSAWTSLPLGNDVPYGCLKGGSKKTYRAWKEGILNEEAANARPPTPPKTTSNPDLRLGGGATVKRDVRMMVADGDCNDDDDIDNIGGNTGDRLSRDAELELDRLHMKRRSSSSPQVVSSSSSPPTPPTSVVVPPRRTLKKTMRRKYTLGRFDKQKKVAVLIKDKHTQKKILNTQRTLKKTPISDVRRYLRQHGMVKIGNTCPPDVLRKTFESAMLAGEITNTNHNTLLHNLIHMDKVGDNSAENES